MADLEAKKSLEEIAASVQAEVLTKADEIDGAPTKSPRITFLQKAKKGDRDHIKLVSNDCPGVVYHTKKNKRNDPDRIELRKYCPKTRSVQVFRETR